MLDVDSGILKNWRDLAEILLEGIESRRRVIDDLELNYFGGGSPGRTFLSFLQWQKPELTKEDLIILCKQYHRYDIVKVLEKGNNSSLWEISNVSRKDLESKLNFNGFWESLADEYDFETATKETIKISLKSGNKSSPTEGLFDFLRQYKPDLGILQLADVCRDMFINNVANELEKIALEMAKIE